MRRAEFFLGGSDFMSDSVKVVVVSDEEVGGDLFRSLFSTSLIDLSFIEVKSYEELAQAAQREECDAIILCLRGTRLRTDDALSYLRPIVPELPIIILAKKSNREELIRAIRAGATEFVSEDEEKELPRIFAAAIENSRDKSGLRAVHAVRPADAFLSFIHNSVSEPLACVSIRENGEFIFSSVNGPFMREAARLGRPMKTDQLIGRSIDEIFRKKWGIANEDWGRFLGLLHKTATTRKRVGFNTIFQGLSQGHVQEFVLIPLLTGELPCEHVLISFRDAGEQSLKESGWRKREGEYIQPQKMESIGALASGIAHDFNNILTCILGYADICMRRAKPGDPVFEGLEQILSASLRARDLVSQILTFGRKHPLEKKRTDLSGVVAEAMNILRSSTPTGVLIVTRLSQNGPEIMADSSQILQILLNLCTNAFHAMEAEGGKLTISVERIRLDEREKDIDSEHAGHHFVRLTVEDSGAGMDEETAQRVFEPFFTTKTPGTGTGLGLSTVRGIVTSHGGFLRVESSLGKGSKFHVFLPAIPLKAHSELLSLDFSSANSRNRVREKILVIDDDQEIANLAVRILESYKYKVVAMNSPQDAIKRLRMSPREFDIVLTDLMMDDLSGHDVVRELKTINAEMPVVLVSGCAGFLNLESAQEAGFAAVIHKPFGIEQLASHVAEVLRSYQSPQ